MSDPLHVIALVACDLKLAAPEPFANLVEAFRAYENKCIDDLLAAGPDGIVGAQGKANAVRAVRTKLQDCMSIRAKLEARK